MIYTGNYANCKGDMCVSISGDKGKDAGYTGRCCLKLAPVRAFWKKWKANIGKIPEIDNTKYYIHEYYTQVLKYLDPKEIAKKLDNRNKERRAAGLKLWTRVEMDELEERVRKLEEKR